MQAQNQHTPHTLEIFSVETETKLIRPIADQGISAGFPSPAQDFMDLSIDLNKEFIKHPASTFFGRVKGNSMIDAGISKIYFFFCIMNAGYWRSISLFYGENISCIKTR